MSIIRQLNPEVPISHTDRPQGVGQEHGLSECESIRNVPRQEQLSVDLVSQPRFCEALEKLPGSPKGKANRGKKEPWPIEPLPVLEVKVLNGDKHTVNAMCAEPERFVMATLLSGDGKVIEGDCLQGNRTTSFFVAQQRAFFIIRDLKIKNPGYYRLRLEMCQMVWAPDGDNMHVVPIMAIDTQVFRAYPKGQQLPAAEPLSQTMEFLQKSGAKLKLRKTPIARKRNSPHWENTMDNVMHNNVPGQILDPRGRGRLSDAAPVILQSLPYSHDISGASSALYPTHSQAQDMLTAGPSSVTSLLGQGMYQPSDWSLTADQAAAQAAFTGAGYHGISWGRSDMSFAGQMPRLTSTLSMPSFSTSQSVIGSNQSMQLDNTYQTVSSFGDMQQSDELDPTLEELSYGINVQPPYHNPHNPYNPYHQG